MVKKAQEAQLWSDNEIAGVGDRVQLMETRPLSATQRWRLVEVP
ncbi:30S ribosomal protein S17, partial [Nocardia sp. NPDC058497]